VPKLAYESWKPDTRTLTDVQRVNAVVADYQRRGFNLTLRQVYYQMVARAFIPNNDREYKRLGEIVNRGRLAGLIDWNAIEDRTRNLATYSSWSGAKDILESALQSYRSYRWANQPHRFEVWVEKEALVDVVSQACSPLFVPYFACRGYVSQSEMWGAAQRLGGYVADGKRVTVVHLGDHDPSGIDMTRDLRDRILQLGSITRSGRVFNAIDLVTVDRIALNIAQVRRYNPPPNPAKLTDSRVDGYISKFGASSWELDALDPQVIVDLIRDRILPHIDVRAWEKTLAEDLRVKATIKAIGDHWDAVKDFCEDAEGSAIDWVSDALDDLKRGQDPDPVSAYRRPLPDDHGDPSGDDEEEEDNDE
jgi:hypothetical protein